MSDKHKETLLKANAAIAQGAIEAFLSFCTDDMEWNFVGEQTLVGKDAVRAYMENVYQEPPVFEVAELIAEGDLLTAIGQITLKDKQGVSKTYQYCDVWRFKDGKMHALRAYVIAAS